MKTMNQVTLYGCVGKEPEIKQTQSGRAVATFSVATSTGGYKGRDGKDVPERTTWHNIVAWDPLHKACSYIHKGDKVLVTGRYESRQYQAADGRSVTVYEVIASDISLPPKATESQQAEVAHEVATPAPIDELPF